MFDLDTTRSSYQKVRVYLASAQTEMSSSSCIDSGYIGDIKCGMHDKEQLDLQPGSHVAQKLLDVEEVS